MARTRRHRRTLLLPWTLLAALLAHGSVIGVYAVTRPVPPPRLRVKLAGQGTGLVTSVPAGVACTESCSAPFPRGTTIRLIAQVQEGSTFEGWPEERCEPRPDQVLECTLVLDEDTKVEARFGLVPKDVEVTWMNPPPAEEAQEQLTVTLPDPEIEAELLSEPLEELLPPEPEPEPAIAVAPPPPPPPPAEAPPPAAPPPPPPLENLRSVEVADEHEVEEAPDDATHLSDKNRDVAEETRAVETNLDRAQAGEATASEESTVESEGIGGEEERIAQLEEAEPTTLDGADEEQLTSGQSEMVSMTTGGEGRDGEDGEAGNDRPSPTPGVLSMRGVTGRGSLLANDAKPGEGGKQGKQGKQGLPGIDKQLSFSDYQRIVGEEVVEREEALGRKKRESMKRGRYQKKLAAVQSALENFTPEVKTGNQTALKTRAAPFALYIARMHRRIHELWGFGFLDELNGKSADHPLNDWSLFTKIEVVINEDGSVHKTTIVTHSGVLEFDVAAIDTLLTASPYQPPPNEIRSPDGRVYLHWGFNRNYRACGTFNVHPFILSEAPAGGDTRGPDDSDLARILPRRTRAQTAAGQGGQDGASLVPSSADRRAEHAANLWANGLSQGDVSKMLKVTGAPFRSRTGVIASSVREVGPIYRQVLSETKGSIRELEAMTAAEYRKRLGALPPGLEDGQGQLLAVLRVGGEQLVLALARQRSGDYLITGLFR